MELLQRISAFLAYLLPVVSWLYAWFFQRKSSLVMFHVRQSIGLFLFVLGMGVGWVIITWLLTWIPFGFLFGVVLFSLVITALIVAVVLWLTGMVYALLGRVKMLPIIGEKANQLPIR
jgi:uncharacterized membrane protein